MRCRCFCLASNSSASSSDAFASSICWYCFFRFRLSRADSRFFSKRIRFLSDTSFSFGSCAKDPRFSTSLHRRLSRSWLARGVLPCATTAYAIGRGVRSISGGVLRLFRVSTLLRSDTTAGEGSAPFFAGGGLNKTVSCEGTLCSIGSSS